MDRNEREKKWKNKSAKINTVIDEFDDIDNLNDDSFIPNPECEKKPMTEEEKKEIRKNVLITLITIVIALILLVLILIFDPFKKINDIFSNDKKTAEETQNDEKINDEISISELTDGDVSLTNEELKLLISEIEYKQNEYFDNDTLFLFTSESVDIKKINDKDKLFLMSKTIEFKELVSNSINNFSICNNNIIISTNDVDQILMSNFNTLSNNYVDFFYSHYNGNDYVKTIKFTYSNGNYVGICHNQNNTLVTASQQKVVSATKKEDKLYIDIKVIFIKESGVYQDVNFKNLISNNLALDIEDYMKSANTYRYTYNILEDSYVLTNVSLIK